MEKIKLKDSFKICNNSRSKKEIHTVTSMDYFSINVFTNSSINFSAGR